MVKRLPATHMQFVTAVWNKRFPGCKPPKGAARTLAPVYEAVGDEEATDRLRSYLQGCPAQYVNLAKFAATHSAYAEESVEPRPKRINAGKAAPIAEVVKMHPTTNLKPVDVEEDPSTGRLRPKR